MLALLVAGCARQTLTSAEAQQLIEQSPRFTAPDLLRVRSGYCSTVDAPADNVASGLGRLQALEAAGAIRIERRAAAPDQCTSTPGPMREWLTISLPDSDSTFHPRALESGDGWEFTLAHRRLVSVGEVTYNNPDDPTLARAAYRWAWRSELLGQLLQVSEEPVNAQATFIRPDGQWMVRDVGF